MNTSRPTTCVRLREVGIVARKRSEKEREANKLRMRVVGACPEYRAGRAAYAKARKDRRKYWINKYKEAKGCSMCDFRGPGYCYDWHHVGVGKDFEINSGQLLFSLKRLFNEMRKCILVCSNCHRKIHGGYCGS